MTDAERVIAGVLGRAGHGDWPQETNGPDTGPFREPYRFCGTTYFLVAGT